MPDWSSLIANDPGFLAAQADLRASGIANQAQRNALFQTDIVNYGQLPDLAKAAAALGVSPGDLSSFLGPNVGKLAQENTDAGTSMLARLNASNKTAIEGIQNSLNARGIYHSGETGYQLGQQNQSYTNSQYDTLRQVLDAMSGAQQNYVSAEQQREIALAQAASDAANRVFANNQSDPGSPSTSANWLYTDANGNNVYGNGDGNFYNADGSAYTGPGYDYGNPGRTDYGGRSGPGIGAFK